MKLAPSEENVALLREVAGSLHQISNTAVQNAAGFVSQAQGNRDGLTDGDAEGLDDVLQYVRGDVQKISEAALELAAEAGQLADDLEQQVKLKVLKL